MESLKIKDKNNKVIANLFCFVDYENRKYKSKNDFVDCLVEKVSVIPQVGYAGFKNKEYLKKHLRYSIFDSEKFKGVPEISFDEKNIREIIADTLIKCKATLDSKKTNLFIFPNFSEYKKEKLNGVGGLCCWKNTILIDINPVKGWQGQLKQTVCHEFHHSVIANKRNPQSWSLLEALVYEGMADNFAEKIIGKSSLWVKEVSKKECLIIFQKLKKNLEKSDRNLYQQVFFGKDKKYPHWTGYSIGYQMVKLYLKSHPDLDWNEISKKSVNIFGKF